jgi:hypothetical protein
MLDLLKFASNTSSRFSLGVYDNSHTIAPQLYQFVGKHQILAIDDNFTMDLSKADPMSHLLPKHYFLACCQSYIIKVDSISSKSVLTGAIRAMITDRLRKLLIITPISISMILSMGDTSEQEVLSNRIKTGSLVNQSEFDCKKAIDMMSV